MQLLQTSREKRAQTRSVVYFFFVEDDGAPSTPSVCRVLSR